VVGTVAQVGSAVSALQVGERVGIGWQRGACLHCRPCLSGDENLCAQNKATIVDGYGGFGDHLKVDSRFAFPLPKGLASESAGPLMCGGVTVYSGLRHAGMTSGQEIGVVGVGGLGHMAVQFASRLGNRVTTFTSSKDKVAFAEKLGASEALLYQQGPQAKPSRPLDIIISTAALDLDWSAFVDLLGPDGTLLFVGVPPKPLNIHAGQLLEQRRRIMASPIGGRGIMTEMLDVADRFKVAPIIERFPFREANKAIERLRNNAVRYRAVLES